MIRSGLVLVLFCLVACAQQNSKLFSPVVVLPPTGGGITPFGPQSDAGMNLGDPTHRIARIDFIRAVSVNVSTAPSIHLTVNNPGAGDLAIFATSNAASQSTAFFEQTASAGQYAVVATNSGGGSGAYVFGGSATVGAMLVQSANAARKMIDFNSSAGAALFVKTGAPSGPCVTGSQYWRLDGGSGTTTYDCEATVWVALSGGGGTSPPFIDTSALIYKSTDPTATLAFKANLISTGTNRNITFQDFDYTTAAIDHVETFTANQTFAANILASGTPDIGAPATPFFNVYFTNDYAAVFKLCSPGTSCGSAWSIEPPTANIMRFRDPSGNVFVDFDKAFSIATWKASLLPGSSSPAVYDIGSVTSPWLKSYVEQGFFTTAAGQAITASSSNAFGIAATVDNSAGGSGLNVTTNGAFAIAIGATNSNPAGVQLQFGPSGAGGIFSVSYYVNNGAPAGGCNNGDMYFRKDGAAGTTFYGCRAGAWAAWF